MRCFTAISQDCIGVLGKTIVKVYLKDFNGQEGRSAWVNLGDGDADWAALREASREMGYSGSAITELKGGAEAYFRDHSRCVDRGVPGRPCKGRRAETNWLLQQANIW